MPQIIECPKCAKKLNAPDKLAGMRVACPACKTPVSIPAIKSTAPNQRPQSQPADARPRVAAAPTQPAKPIAGPITATIQCPHCTKKFKGPVQLQGKNIPCPACRKEFVVRLQPAAPTKPAANPLAKAKPTAPPMPPRQPAIQPARPTAQPALAAKAPVARPPVASLAPGAPQKSAATNKSPTPAPTPKFSLARRRPRLLYLIFALAFVPLTLQTLGGDGDFEERLSRTLAADPGLKEKLEKITSPEEVFTVLPDHRIEGALLSHDSHAHWIYALASASVFFAVCWLLFDPGKATVAQWLIVLAVTATVGIISLLAFQWMAAITQGVWITGRGVIMLLFYIVKFIGYSYSAANDPDSNFLLSFLGFTCGVGLCEEVTKAIPVIVWLGEDKKLDWRAACILGLASGVGFGVVEGIIYAGSHYNGLTTADIYFTRFISCVALHATWTAAVALMAVRNLGGFDTSEGSDYAVHMLLIISVPAILHGLYDTLLKKGFDGYALAVALVSFAWLALLIERARSSDDESVPRRLAPAAA